jgi:predicted nucleic acid-binding protein
LIFLDTTLLHQIFFLKDVAHQRLEEVFCKTYENEISFIKFVMGKIKK